MKKKAALAGIPRASGERNSPTGNGSFGAHNQVGISQFHHLKSRRPLLSSMIRQEFSVYHYIQFLVLIAS